MKQKKGFTLIEFLLGLIILVIGLVGTSAFFYANSKSMVRAQLRRFATWKAIDKLETVKGTDYSQIPNGTTTETITIGDIQAQRITTVTEDTSISLKTVSVQVLWDNNTVALSTMIAKQ